MDAPFGIDFLKKAELFNLIKRLDKQYGKSGFDNPWPIEKRILRWTYGHHKNLGSPITTDHLSRGNGNSKLKDFGITDSKGNIREQFKYLEKNSLTKILENLVVRGFAEYFDIKNDHNAIIINKEGLLVGEVINDIEKNNALINFNYFVYSNLMDHAGAFLLLVITLFTLIKIFF